MTLFSLASKNLFRTRALSCLSILGMALAIACGGIVLRLNILAENRFSTIAPIGDVFVGPKAGPIELLLQIFNGEGQPRGLIPENLYRTLKADVPVGAWLEIGIAQGFRVVGSEDIFNKNTVELAWHEGHEPGADLEMALGAVAAERLHLKTGDSFPYQGDTYKISGVLTRSGHSTDRVIFLTLGQAQALYPKLNALSGPWGNRVMHAMIGHVPLPMRGRLRELVDFKTVAEYVDVAQTVQDLEKVTGGGRWISTIVAAIVTVLGGMLVAVLLATRFEAQAAQVALLRVLGFQRREVLLLLWLESLILCGGAWLIGASLDWALFPFFKSMVEGFLPVGSAEISLLRSWPVWIFAFVAVLVSLVGPFIKMLRTDVHLQLQRLT